MTALRAHLAVTVAVLSALVLALVLTISGSPVLDRAHAAGGNPVTAVFTGTGTYSVSQHATGDGGQCSWTTTFDLVWEADFPLTSQGGSLQGGSGALVGDVGTATMTPSGTCPGGCSTTLAASGTPTLDSDGATDPTVQAQSLGPISTLDCPAVTKGLIGSDLTVLDAALPGLTTGVGKIPASTLANGGTIAVSSADAPSQIASSCMGVGHHGSGVDSCTASGSWTGSIEIVAGCDESAAIGHITVAVGGSVGGNPVHEGDPICTGQKVKTGPHDVVELTFQDGSVVHLGPSSEATIEDTEFVPSTKIDLKGEIGHIWAKVSTALGGDDRFEVTTERAVAGVRGSEATYDELTEGVYLVHTIEGTGFYKFNGHPEIDYPAGLSLICREATGKCTETTSWPAADQELVPAEFLPPKVSAPGFHGTIGKPAMRIGFTSERAGTGRTQILKGTKVLHTKTFRVAKGANTVKPLSKALDSGHYTVRLWVADADGRTRALDVPMNVS